MPKIPSVSFKKVIGALEKCGYVISRQRGSHIRMCHNSECPVTIPAHNPVARGTLRKILRDSKLSVEEFIELL
jgi:predicted RNA binding protein YcfA (HicA-like mRNA interferase family)